MVVVVVAVVLIVLELVVVLVLAVVWVLLLLSVLLVMVLTSVAVAALAARWWRRSGVRACCIFQEPGSASCRAGWFEVAWIVPKFFAFLWRS